MENPPIQSYGLGHWLSQSVSAKLLFIGVLVLLLLIPSSWIGSLIRERQSRQQSVVAEIGRKWSGPQVLGGPMLVLPYTTMVKVVVATGVEQLEERTQYLYLLPDELKVDATTDTELLHRGIFDAAVYQAQVKVDGHFGPVDLAKAELDGGQVQWEKARIAVGVGDLKGLKDSPVIHVAGERYEPQTDFANIGGFGQNLMVAPKLTGELWEKLPFSFTLDLRGSEYLRFMQLAKSTSISIAGNWPLPSFGGQFLPENREVTPEGFTAKWSVPYFSRQLPQQWTAATATTINQAWEEESDMTNTMYRDQLPVAIEGGNQLEAGAFGVLFLQPVDHYQKAERTAKYAILIILLTFVSLFFTEIIAKKRVHIIQYLLIGAAMIVYYCLLLSFAEHVGFNVAYLIASVATIVLVATFIERLLRQRRTAMVFSGILTLFYVFIFVIIQLQDMALLFGSIGLFITVALLMHFSGRINWQREEEGG
ncbi:cell envelope integrity protein CreD [Parapedobacter sp. 2B3]|uniref:cell envelope integrity protein CreD n=1 Tax=Parapedobacter sp. 2B3 TaxID=3342381 RepID=UPI0035B67387